MSHAPNPSVPPSLRRAPPRPHGPEEVFVARSLYWQSVVQEALLSLPYLTEGRPELLDGRIAVLTRAGERIPIRRVAAMLPVSMAAQRARPLSQAVQCTVFRIETPTGEVFMLPLEQIRGLHLMSEELMGLIEEQARRLSGAVRTEDSIPFGFAAFQHLAEQGGDDDSPGQPR